MIDKTIEALTNLEKRPEIILGKKSITLLYAFVGGLECSFTNNWRNIPDKLFTGEFNRWVSKKYEVTDSLHWASIILKQTNGNEEKAFDLFYLLLKEYAKGLTTIK